MKKIVILLLVLILCGGGGYYFYTHKGDPATTEEKPAEKTAETTTAPAVPIFVPISPFVLPVIGDNGPQQLITLVISLQVAKESDQNKIKDLMPRLNDAFMQNLYGALDRGTIRNGRLVDIVKVKKKIQDACDKVLGPDVVTSVLVQGIAQRQF